MGAKVLLNRSVKLTATTSDKTMHLTLEEGPEVVGGAPGFYTNALTAWSTRQPLPPVYLQV